MTGPRFVKYHWTRLEQGSTVVVTHSTAANVRADVRAQRSRVRPQQRKVAKDPVLQARVGADLTASWTPNEIAGRVRLEAAELLESVGIDEPGLHQLARKGFHTLGLQTYLTAGPKEARAWTIHKGWTAPKAAGVIHTDFEKGFIKAEVVSFEDLDELGSMNAAREAGRVRMEGKEYVMADGDVVEFRFNV